MNDGGAGGGEGSHYIGPGRVLTRRQVVLTALAAAGALVLTGCGEQLPTYRYRLTVEVETPEGLRTGSSVIEVRTRRGSGIPGPEAGGIGSTVRGEAVAVDLGPRGTLFALLSGPGAVDHAAGIAPSVLLPELPDRRGTPEAWGVNLRALKEVRGPAAVGPSHYPPLVRLRDIRDPKTVEQVRAEALTRHFGAGVYLRQISIEITDDPVTEGITSRLPWWDAFENKQLDGDRLVRSQSLANNLNRRAFKQGE